MSGRTQTSFDKPSGTFKRMPLLTADELAFFNMLATAIDSSHAIFTKVPLEKIIHPSSASERSFLRFAEVDYLICDRSTSLPICVIDINPEPAPTPLTYLLNTSGIAIIHLDSDITAEDLRRKIATAKPIIDMKFPEEVADVAVTVIKRTSGRQQGQASQIRDKPFPKIVNILGRSKKERIIRYAHWAIWIIFALVILITLFLGPRR